MTIQEWLGEDNKLGHDIWNNKYRYKDETLDEWFDRVSGGNEKLKQLIIDKKFLFGGRTLANRGTNKSGSFSNCYSRGFLKDDLDDLMQASSDIAKTFKAQGGQGVSLSKLRPKGCGINHGQFESDGIIPFMEIYNRTTESISQGGSRKGALIMTLDAWHKEAEDFIKIKSEEGRIQKANLSLEIDDEFMECVKTYYETGKIITKHIIKYYSGNKVEYDIVPIQLYKLMMEKAYDWAEPGCIFTNRFRNYNLMEFCEDYNIETCNPCGEQPLPKNGACNLGSINLAQFVVNPFTKIALFNFDNFANAIDIAVEALDTVLDENINNHPLKEQQEMAYNYRNIGLGIMGLHDTLIQLGMSYGSEESKQFVDSVCGFMFRRAVIASSKLAKEKGTFPKYNSNVLKSSIIKKHFTDDDLSILKINRYGLRNCSLLSIAPSGSIGTMLNISTGCEPLFQISYQRKTESLNGEDMYYDVYAGIAQAYINTFNTTNLPTFFNTSSDVNWKDRIDMQSSMQNHIDTAISSTINLPHDITCDEIEQLYLYAWEKGLKGITIFRDGCKRAGILTTDTKNDTDNNSGNRQFPRGYIITADDNVIGLKRKVMSGCGSLHVVAMFDPDNGELLETYLSKGSTGGCQSNLAAVSRLISLSARAGVDVYTIADQLQSCMACPSYVGRTMTKHDTSKGKCCPDAVGNALIDMYTEMQNSIRDDLDNYQERTEKPVSSKPHLIKQPPKSQLCPVCGEPLIYEGGCNVCRACGWSKCD